MKYLFRMLITFTTIMQLTGCGATFKIERIEPTQEKTYSYEIGKPISATVGTEMISIKNMFTLPRYTPVFAFQPPAAVFSDMPQIKPGLEWVAFFGHDDLYIISSFEYAKEVGIEINKNGQVINSKPWIGLANFITSSSGKTVRMYQKSWDLPDRQLFKPDGFLIKEGSYKIDLVYGGKLNNVLEIIIKEYIDDLSKVFKSQSIKHDLSSGDTISYKTLKMQVIEATDSKITFKVLEDGGLPWVFERK